MKSTHASRQFASMKDSIRDGEEIMWTVMSVEQITESEEKRKELFLHFCLSEMEANTQMLRHAIVVSDFFAGKPVPTSATNMKKILAQEGIQMPRNGAIYAHLFAR